MLSTPATSNAASHLNRSNLQSTIIKVSLDLQVLAYTWSCISLEVTSRILRSSGFGFQGPGAQIVVGLQLDAL